MPKLLVVLLLCFSLLVPSLARAQSTPQEHLTVFLMQVRGPECCGAGGVEEVHNWVTAAQEARLPLTLAVRYDALQSPTHVPALRLAQRQGHELAALLEVTPNLASASGVVYRGTSETWSQAEQVFLLGYTKEERQKLIDTYLQRFAATFDTQPTTTVAWMIDAWSLQYLAQEYGITVHELTREQWGVDSYTLHGGPPHNPYWPSAQWPLIPDPASQGKLPLIVRQTVDDPVWSYGDTTSSYTTQPNDYARKNRGWEYFRFLFAQAHEQDNPQTIAVLGLENSMPAETQAEFLRQIAEVGRWQQENPAHRVVTARQLSTVWRAQEMSLYAGQDQESGEKIQAWWITTPTYRARLRYEAESLYVSDLRLYHPELTDPYREKTAQGGGWWVVPFLLDGARYFVNGASDAQLWHDSLSERELRPEPTRWVVAQDISPEQLRVQRDGDGLAFRAGSEQLARFTAQNFALAPQTERRDIHPNLQSFLQNLEWKGGSGEILWRLVATEREGLIWYEPEVRPTGLDAERSERYSVLLPELIARALSATATRLDVKNRYAMIGRNPVRLALWPRDETHLATQLTQPPQVEVLGQNVSVSTTSQQFPEGYIFIDITTDTPQTVATTITVGEFSRTEDVYFVPNCRREILSCVTDPLQSWRYLRLRWEDRERERAERQ